MCLVFFYLTRLSWYFYIWNTRTQQTCSLILSFVLLMKIPRVCTKPARCWKFRQLRVVAYNTARALKFIAGELYVANLSKIVFGAEWSEITPPAYMHTYASWIETIFSCLSNFIEQAEQIFSRHNASPELLLDVSSASGEECCLNWRDSVLTYRQEVRFFATLYIYGRARIAKTTTHLLYTFFQQWSKQLAAQEIACVSICTFFSSLFHWMPRIFYFLCIFFFKPSLNGIFLTSFFFNLIPADCIKFSCLYLYYHFFQVQFYRVFFLKNSGFSPVVFELASLTSTKIKFPPIFYFNATCVPIFYDSPLILTTAGISSDATLADTAVNLFSRLTDQKNEAAVFKKAWFCGLTVYEELCEVSSAMPLSFPAAVGMLAMEILYALFSFTYLFSEIFVLLRRCRRLRVVFKNRAPEMLDARFLIYCVHCSNLWWNSAMSHFLFQTAEYGRGRVLQKFSLRVKLYAFRWLSLTTRPVDYFWKVWRWGFLVLRLINYLSARVGCVLLCLDTLRCIWWGLENQTPEITRTRFLTKEFFLHIFYLKICELRWRDVLNYNGGDGLKALILRRPCRTQPELRRNAIKTAAVLINIIFLLRRASFFFWCTRFFYISWNVVFAAIGDSSNLRWSIFLRRAFFYHAAKKRVTFYDMLSRVVFDWGSAKLVKNLSVVATAEKTTARVVLIAKIIYAGVESFFCAAGGIDAVINVVGAARLFDLCGIRRVFNAEIAEFFNTNYFYFFCDFRCLGVVGPNEKNLENQVVPLWCEAGDDADLDGAAASTQFLDAAMNFMWDGLTAVTPRFFAADHADFFYVDTTRFWIECDALNCGAAAYYAPLRYLRTDTLFDAAYALLEEDAQSVFLWPRFILMNSALADEYLQLINFELDAESELEVASCADNASGGEENLYADVPESSEARQVIFDALDLTSEVVDTCVTAITDYNEFCLTAACDAQQTAAADSENVEAAENAKDDDFDDVASDEDGTSDTGELSIQSFSYPTTRRLYSTPTRPAVTINDGGINFEIDWFSGNAFYLNRFRTFTLHTLIQHLAPYRCGVQLNWKYL